MSTKTTKRKRASAAAAAEPVVVAHVTPEQASIETPAPVAAAIPTVAEPSAAKPADGPTIRLSSNCTVKDASALKLELLQLMDEQGSVAIDAKSVERIDTAIMQLLCAFVRDRAERNLSVAWGGAPQPLLDSARLLGVGALLALPTEAAP